MPSFPTISAWRPDRSERATIDQYLLLSMLVHVLLIVSLSDVTGGASKSAQQGWGSIKVTLGNLFSGRAPAASGAITNSATVAPAPRRTPGAANTPSQGKLLLPEEAAPPPQAPSPDAALPEAPDVLAKPVTTPTSDFVVPLPAPGKESAPPADVAPAPVPPPMPVRSVSATPLDAIKLDSPTKSFAETPKLPDPRPLPTQIPTRIAPLDAPKIESTFAPPVVLTPRDIPALTPLAPIAAPATVKDMAPAPSLTPTPIVAPSPLETIPAPTIDRTFAAPIDAKALQAPAPAPTALTPISPIAPAKIEREFATPVQLNANDIRVAPPAPLTPIAPAKIDREMTPFAEFATPRGESNVGGKEAPRSEAQPASPASANDRFAPARPDANGGSASRRESPVRDANTAPKIDLDALKDRARAITREGTGPRTVLPFLTAPKPPPKSAVQQAFDKALQRPDCKEAYANLGLAAVIPLVRDAVTEKGCKW